MTKKETLEAALALGAWLKSQDIKGADRVLVLMHYIAAEIVEQGTTPARFEEGMQILCGILCETSREAMDYAKRMGIR